MKISTHFHTIMRKHIQACLPEEGCGVLCGKNDSITRVIPITNVLHSPSRFRMDGEEQLQAFLWLEKNNMELVGIFHSHPQGPDHPSPTDIAEFSYPGVAYLIWTRGSRGWLVRAYQIEEHSYREILLKRISRNAD